MNGVLAVAALLLVGAGAAKVARPETTAKALGVNGGVVRAGAGAEAALGLLTLGFGGTVLAALVSASYAAFAVYVARSLRRGAPLSTCACFGEEDTPATALHVVLDLGLSAGAGAAALGRAAPVGLPVLGVAAVVAYVGFLALTSLPRTAAAARR